MLEGKSSPEGMMSSTPIWGTSGAQHPHLGALGSTPARPSGRARGPPQHPHLGGLGVYPSTPIWEGSGSVPAPPSRGPRVPSTPIWGASGSAPAPPSGRARGLSQHPHLGGLGCPEPPPGRPWGPSQPAWRCPEPSLRFQQGTQKPCPSESHFLH